MLFVRSQNIESPLAPHSSAVLRLRVKLYVLLDDFWNEKCKTSLYIKSYMLSFAGRDLEQTPNGLSVRMTAQKKNDMTSPEVSSSLRKGVRTLVRCACNRHVLYYSRVPECKVSSSAVGTKSGGGMQNYRDCRRAGEAAGKDDHSSREEGHTVESRAHRAPNFIKSRWSYASHFG